MADDEPVISHGFKRSVDVIEFKADPPTVTLGCDCGTVTEIEIVGLSLGEVHELAYTCQGCTSVHWFVVGRLEGNRG